MSVAPVVHQIQAVVPESQIQHMGVIVTMVSAGGHVLKKSEDLKPSPHPHTIIENKSGPYRIVGYP